MTNEYLLILGISLGLTVFMEVTLAFIVGIRSSRDLILVLLVNVFTNPAAVICYYIFTFYTQMSILILKILIEIVVILIEGVYYRRYAGSVKRPFMFSALANILSFGAGLVLNTVQ